MARPRFTLSQMGFVADDPTMPPDSADGAAFATTQVANTDEPDTFERELAAALTSHVEGSSGLIGHTIAETYEIVSLLGQGGMGKVFLAKHLRTGGQVALKLMQSSTLDNDSFLKRFELEAKHTARLTHPTIVRVFDYGTDDGLVYIAMEYVDGRSISQLVADGALPVALAVEIVAQVLIGLQQAHEEGLIHRDIKPANILVAGDRDSPFVKVLDFGISRALEGPTADTQGVIGSPHSMAPEQFNGEPVTAQTDLYAVGCTMFAMLCGNPPYEGTFFQLAFQHVQADIPTLDDAPDELAAWVYSLLAKDPDNRPKSAKEALARLRALDISAVRDKPPRHEDVPSQPSQQAHGELTSEPDAAEPSTTEQTTNTTAAEPQPAQNRSTRFTALTGVALLVVLLGAVAVWQWKMWPESTNGTTESESTTVESDPGLSGPAAEPDGTPRTTTVSSPTTDNPPPRVQSTVRAALPIIASLERFQFAVDPTGSRVVFLYKDELSVLSLRDELPRTIELPRSIKDSPLMATWFPDGERLLVSVYDKNDEQLWVVPLQGEVRKLADGRYGKISPDGQRLAFLTNRGLVIGKSDGSELTLAEPIERRAGKTIAWLSDSSAVVYPVAIGDSGKVELRLASVGKPSTRLIGDLRNNLFWNAVTFTTGPNRTLLYSQGPRLFVATVLNGGVLSAPDEIHRHDSDGYASLTLDASGSKATWCRIQGDRFDAEIASLTGNKLGRPDMWKGGQDSRVRYVPTDWSAEGLLFTSDETGNPRIHLGQPGGSSRPLTNSGTQTGAVFAPDGKRVLFHEYTPKGREARLLSDGVANPVPIAKRKGVGRASYRCNGSTCVQITITDLAYEFRRLDLSAGTLDPVGTIVIEDDTEYVDGRPWDLRDAAPEIALIDRQPANRIKTMDIKTGEVATITLSSDKQRIHHLSWDAAERGWFAAGTSTGTTFDLYRIEPDGRLRVLTTGPDLHTRPVPSPDGKALAWGSAKVRCVPQLTTFSWNPHELREN